MRVRLLVGVAGILFAATVGIAQEPAGPLAPPPPLVVESPPVLPPAPPATTYAPGDGLTVSMLNGTSTLKLFGQFSTIGVASTTRPFPVGGPLFLLPPSSVGNNTNTFDISARQTAFGAIFTGPELFGFTPGATVLAFIQNDSLTSDAYGFLPYNVYGELRNDEWRFAAGLMSDVFNPANPTIISLLKLFASGNTGSFAGSMRVEHFYKPADAFQLTTQLAVRKPVASVVTNNRVVEDNGWPNVEGRAAVGLGEAAARAGGRKLRPVEVGVSGVVGQLRNSKVIASPTDNDVSVRSTIDVFGVGADAQVAFTDRCGFVGEFYAGQGMGEYNGGIGQTFGTSLKAIRSVGGFGEVYCYFTDALHLHTGYGIDAPLRGDLTPSQVARNQTYFANLIWDASKTMQLSFEVDYRRTEYVSLREGRGVVFLGQFLLKF